ncbi:hypothetical protein Tco_1090990 [Tanacetum coccineum]|uniref:Uncharacterized protein n=1 Tax=Tanacetum coccineum TaxID=301880 RepID=A0ABQ5I7P4_9ASTR
MVALKFASSHNMVAFLDKQIVDFLNAHPIKYALTIQALVDKKKVIITETSIRSDLQLEDAKGTECLPNATTFEQLTLIGYENLTQKLTFYKFCNALVLRLLLGTNLVALWPQLSSVLPQTKNLTFPSTFLMIW